MLLLLLLALPLPAQDWKAITEWRPTAFQNAGVPVIEKELITLPPGSPMTGVTAPNFEHRINYEIRFEASRTMGNDFFASLTFPYKDSHATWVNGGWGGDIVGISSIDNWDASENETRAYFNFENERYYRFRIQVSEQQIKAWIDDRQVIDLPVNGRTISLRRGMMPTTPLSIFSYNTASKIRNVQYRVMTTR